MSAVPKSYLARRLATDLRRVASIMPPAECILGNSFSLRLTREQAEDFRRIIDRGAFIVDRHADVMAREEGDTLGKEPQKRGPKKKTPAEAGAE